MSKRNKTTITAEPGKQEFFITREFEAPRELVFKAFTDPELYVQWLGLRGYRTRLVTFEPRSGGLWRYLQQDENGREHGFHGVYHEVAAPERIIDTFEYDGLGEAGHVALETLRFEALNGGRTRITEQSVFQSAAERDAMIQSGMEGGVTDSHARLDELLDKMKQSA